MRNVMKYLGIMSVSLACAGPLFATSVQPFAGVTVVQQSVVTVKGQVVDEKGEPIIGANVIVEGTTNGMITDLDGNFSLQCPVGSTLKTSYIGYLARTVKVTGNMNALKITLKEDTETLDEVVVVGYGTMKKSDLTGSVASVNAEEMMKRNPVNLGQGLQGAAAGVSVIRSSGDPEGGFSIRIRGVATVNGSADPLYVVDGVQVGTSIDFLNPNDVESIEILKDASATAIYGTRGANGVIMITTKNGGKGKAKVNFSANYALQFNSNKIDVADAGLFASAVRSAVKNDGIAMTNLAYGEDYIGRLNSIDWQDEMSRTALQQNYNLSASGGSENTQANLSLGYLNNQGIVIESNFKRLTARANITHKVKDFLHVGLNLNYAHSEKMGGGNLRNYAQAIPTMDYVEDGVFYSMPIVLPDGTWGHYKKEGNGDVNKGADNLVAAAKTADSINKWDRLLASAFLQLDLYKGLTFKTIASYNYYTKGYNGYTAYNDRTFGTQDRKDSFSLNQSQSTSLGLEAFLNYDWSNEHHRVSAMAGFSTSDTNGAWLNSSANDFPADNIRKISLTNDPSSKQTDGGLDLKTRFLSYFGRLTYTLNDRYIVTATVRRDGSSNFGAGNRYGTFPSASVAWRLSEEKFIKDLELFSNLKLRAGWGQTGNANGLGLYPSYTLVSTGGLILNNSYQQIAQLKTIGNTELTWEHSDMFNIGLDARLLNSRLSFTGEYYVKNTRDILLAMPVPLEYGFGKPNVNIGQVRNKGWELSLGWSDRVNDFGYSISANLSDNRSKVVDLGDTGPWKGSNTYTEVGLPFNSIYGYESMGLFQSDKEVADAPFQNSKTGAGDIRYKDQNGDNKIDANDRVVLGDPNPHFLYGLNLSLDYKNFDLGMFFQGVGQRDRIVNDNFVRPLNDASIFEHQLDYWTPQNTDARYPRILNKSDANHNYENSDYWMINAGYLRMKNLTLGYTIPRKVLSSTGFSRVRVYFTANNLFTISDFVPGMDPEASSAWAYPFARTYSFGLNVQF